MRDDVPHAQMSPRANYPRATSASVTASMKGNRRSDTKPETRVRSLLHRRGLRYRKDTVVVAGSRRCRPDIIFTKLRIAVFIDGCFWHSCPEHGRMPGGPNRAYWVSKLNTNEERDRLDSEALRNDGWRVLRIWEHVSPPDAAALVERVVGERSAS